MNILLKEKIDSIDLSNVKLTMQEPNGDALSIEEINSLEAKYKEFLYEAGTSSNVIPSREVDMMWHHHILDTRAYAADCNRVFGKMIHHFHRKECCGQGGPCTTV